MYKTFKDLAVKDESELRDADRIRRLARRKHFGLKVASACCLAAGAASFALAAWTVIARFTGKPAMPPEAFWPLLGVGFFGGVMTAGMGAVFLKETLTDPLSGYLKEPARYAFALGSITDAAYLSDGRRSGARMLAQGKFGENGIFFEEFDPDLWSDAVAEKGEKRGLRPGDDRYDQKGKRVKLPLDAWVLYRTDKPRYGALAGLPAETAAGLDRSRPRK